MQKDEQALVFVEAKKKIGNFWITTGRSTLRDAASQAEA